MFRPVNVFVLFALLLTSMILVACAGRPSCDPISGFELGRDNATADARCDVLAYGEAWRLGQTLGQLEAEFSALERVTGPTVAQQQRMRVLQREIPELKTLARLDGLLPAESIDGQRP